MLSLREHNLLEIPVTVFELTNVRTLDLSNNKLKEIPSKITTFTKLKSLRCDGNLLRSGSLSPAIGKMPSLQIFSAGDNKLGVPLDHGTSKKQKGNKKSTKNGDKTISIFPDLPPTLKQLKLDSNQFESIPMQICDPTLLKLEKLDLSRNNLASIPPEIANLSSLIELNLDGNCIVSLPEEVGTLGSLKALSLQSNQIQVYSTSFSAAKPQPLPAVLFTSTPLIDLNLMGNQMTNTQLNEFEGFDIFLERRQKLKSKNIYGGALTDLSVCGLE